MAGGQPLGVFISSAPAVIRLSGLNCSSLDTRSVASGDALGNMCCHVRGLSTGRDSSMVAAKGDWMAWMSSWLGRPA